MTENKSIEDLRKCFNQSIFFSTEVSSRSQLQNESSQGSNNMFRISSKFTDEPRTYLRKIKIKRKETDKKCLQALKSNIKAKNALQKAEHEALICRYDFIKLYHNKKFRLVQQNLVSEFKLDNEYLFRQTLDKIRKQKMVDQLVTSLRKQEEDRKKENLQQINKQNEKIFRQTMRYSEQKHRQRIFYSCEKVKKDRNEFINRKRNLSELNSTRSKFNYMSKINDQMQVIKNYQDRLLNFNNEQQRIEQSTPRIFNNTCTANFI